MAATRRVTRAAAAVLAVAIASADACRENTPAPLDDDAAEVHDIQFHARRVFLADSARDYARARALADSLAARAPQHPFVLHLAAASALRAGDRAAALDWLAQAARIGDGRDVSADTAYAPLVSDARFKELASRFRANAAPVGAHVGTLTIPGERLLPEGMAFDASSRTLLFGSLLERRVVAFGPDSVVREVVPRSDSVLRVVGMHVDSARRVLWFATWAPGVQLRPAVASAPTRARLFAYDLAGRRLLRSYEPADTSRGHLLNDFAISADGSLFITDTDAGHVYRLRRGSESLELFTALEPGRYDYPNGVALSNDGLLYVATAQGIAVLDTATRTVRPLEVPDDVTTANIDGLYWRRGSLFAVQTIPTLERAVRFDLSADGRRVTGAETLVRGHAAFHSPTTGLIAGETFYVIANAQYDLLRDDGSVAPARRPVPTVVLRIPIRRR